VAANLDHDDPVTISADPKLPLVLEAHHRAIINAGGQFEVDRLAIGQRDALIAPGGGIGEGHGEAVLDIGPATRRRGWRRLAAEPAARACTRLLARFAPEQPFEQVAEINLIGADPAEIRAARPRAIRAAASVAAARAHPGKGVGRIALAIDFAAIKLGALGLVGQQIIGAGDVGKSLRRVGFVLVAIGVQFLGELAIGALDVRFGRGAGYAKRAVRIAHAVLARCNSGKWQAGSRNKEQAKFTMPAFFRRTRAPMSLAQQS